MATRLYARNSLTVPTALRVVPHYNDLRVSTSGSAPATYYLENTVRGDNTKQFRYNVAAGEVSEYAIFSERAAAEFTLSGDITVHADYDAPVSTTVKLRAWLSKITVGGSDVETPIGYAESSGYFAGAGQVMTVIITPTVPVIIAPNERLILRLRGYLDGGSWPANVTDIKLGGAFPGDVWMELTETTTFKANGTPLYARRTNTIGIGTFLDLLTTVGSSAFTQAQSATITGGTSLPWTLTKSNITAAEITAAAIQDTSNATAYVSPSFAAVANRLYLLAVVHTDAAPEATVPTVSGTTGLTWVQVGSSVPYNTIASNANRLTIFRAMKASGLSAGTYTVNLADAATGCATLLVEAQGVLTTGTDGANAVRNIVTNNADTGANPTVTPGAFAQAYNGVIGFFGGLATGQTTSSTGASVDFVGFSVKSYVTPSASLYGNYKPYNAISTVGITHTTEAWAGMALELVSATSPAIAEWISPRIKTPWVSDTAVSYFGLIEFGSSNVLANAGITVKLYRRQPNGTETLMATWDPTSEGGTIQTAPDSVSSVQLSEDDRLVVRPTMKNAGGTMAGGYYGTLNYDDNLATTFHHLSVTIYESPDFKSETDPAKSDVVPSGGSTMGVSNGM